MNVKELVAKMTLEEKAGMCSGSDFWHTEGLERLGIPKMMVTDGPHGLRKQDGEGDHLGLNDSVKAVCFPAGCATASSFDRDLIYSMGEALGEECQAENVGVILGPGANIKRSPLCGRNFEYFSEDPYLASEMAASQIKGVQSKNVGTSLKHFYANNQEHRRMTSSSVLDERTAREIYLAAFEGAVKQAKPWTVMCSYNRINGVYAAENEEALTDILRGEWGFDGLVVSDWGAVNDRVPDLKAGLDLEMPASMGMNDKKIVEAVKNGELDEAVLDGAVERILDILYRFEENKDKNAVFHYEKDHALARKIASECMVLLKNDGVLPLKEQEQTAFIGAFAEHPRYQGGGSSHINAWKVDSALEMAKDYPVVYEKGFDIKEDRVDEALLHRAVEAAKKVKTAVIFAGLPDAFESEGYDRKHMRLPDCQNRLIEAVCEVNENVVVILHNGSPVEMPWACKVKGILEAYLGGQAVGSAVMDVLYGKVNPSGHLAETFPVKLQDNPSYLYYTGEGDKVEYREGVFVGYRYYDKKEMDVLFPFGHGLSYTTFSYSNMKLDKASMKDTESVTVSVDVTNTGGCFGKEVVQLYVCPPKGEVIRPVKELKGFEKVALMPGETKTVTFTLGKRAFAYYDCDIKDFYVETGVYRIALGQSSRKLLAKKELKVEASAFKKVKLTLNTTFGDILKIPGAAEKIKELMAQTPFEGEKPEDDGNAEMMEMMMQYMPVRALLSFGRGVFSQKDLENLLQVFEKMQEA